MTKPAAGVSDRGEANKDPIAEAADDKYQNEHDNRPRPLPLMAQRQREAVNKARV